MSRPTAAGTTAGSGTLPETVVNATLLRQAMTSVVDAGIFNQLKLHGNTKWQPISLVVLAVLWVWADSDTLTGAFACMSRWAMDLFGCVAVTTYQGLTSGLVTGRRGSCPCCNNGCSSMQECGKENWRIGRWRTWRLMARGSARPAALPMKAFCAPNYGKGKTAQYRKKNKKKRRASEPVKPQVWLTLMWHMGLRLPWCWQTGPSHASERDRKLPGLVAAAEVSGKHAVLCGRGLHRLRLVAWHPGGQAELPDPRRRQRDVAAAPGVCARVRRPGVLLARQGGQEASAARWCCVCGVVGWVAAPCRC